MIDRDTDIVVAKFKLRRRFGPGVRLSFGKIRRDGTRGVTLRDKGGRIIGSYSYLTDIGEM